MSPMLTGRWRVAAQGPGGTGPARWISTNATPGYRRRASVSVSGSAAAAALSTTTSRTGPRSAWCGGCRSARDSALAPMASYPASRSWARSRARGHCSAETTRIRGGSNMRARAWSSATAGRSRRTPSKTRCSTSRRAAIAVSRTTSAVTAVRASRGPAADMDHYADDVAELVEALDLRTRSTSVIPRAVARSPARRASGRRDSGRCLGALAAR